MVSAGLEQERLAPGPAGEVLFQERPGSLLQCPVSPSPGDMQESRNAALCSPQILGCLDLFFPSFQQGGGKRKIFWDILPFGGVTASG